MEVSAVDSTAAIYVANLCNYANDRGEQIRSGFAGLKAKLPENPGKTFIRRLERLTRIKPRIDALDFSEPASFFLKQAMLEHGEFELHDRWGARHSLSTRIEKVDLIRDCKPFAREAIQKLTAQSKTKGRPEDHGQHAKLHAWASTFEHVLGITPTHRAGSKCRRLIAACADCFGVYVQEVRDPSVTAPTIKKALAEIPKFAAFSFAHRTNLPN